MTWELPYGLRIRWVHTQLAASRHMAMYGTTAEQLAQVAVSAREWAAAQPAGPRFQDPSLATIAGHRHPDGKHTAAQARLLPR